MTLTQSYIPIAKKYHGFNFNPEENLPLRPDSLWKIESGVVKITTYSEDGNLIVLGLWGDGDIVSKNFGKVEPYYITCVTKVTANIIPFDDPSELTQVILSHLEQMQELALIRSYKRVDFMLVKLLQWLGKKFGKKTNDGNLIDLRLTHQDLADILGSTRVTITKFLNHIEKQGFIQRLSSKKILLIKEGFWHYQI
jgi:CRP-like cAMP-binding protein